MNFFSNPKSNRQSILFFCLASLIMLLCGVSYSWSLFVVPIEMEMQWSRSTLALAYSYNLYAYCLGGVFAGFARRKINFRQIMFAGVFLMGLGYAGLSTVKSSGHLFLFSILRGWGNGMLYNTILALAPVFFGEKNMFYTGFLLFALGMSSMLLSPLLNWGITFWGWRMVFLVIGLVDAVLLFICTIFIPRPFALNSSSINKVKPEKSLWGLSSKEMLATPVFWLAFLWSTIFGLIGQAYVSQAAACATDIRATALQASLVVSLFSACNGIGRILLGKVYNIGRFRMGIILVCLEFLSG